MMSSLLKNGMPYTTFNHHTLLNKLNNQSIFGHSSIS